MTVRISDIGDSPLSVKEDIFLVNDFPSGQAHSLLSRLHGVGTNQKFLIKYTSMKALDESNEDFDADEVYALILRAGWGPENDCKPWVKVTRTKTYEDVDSGEHHGDYADWDDKPVWGPDDEASQFILGRQVILVQAMEHDSGSPIGIRRALAAVMLPKLKKLLSQNISRSEILSSMRSQMRKTIKGTKDLDPEIFFDKFLENLEDTAIDVFNNENEFDWEDPCDYVGLISDLTTEAALIASGVDPQVADYLANAVGRFNEFGCDEFADILKEGEDFVDSVKVLEITYQNLADAKQNGKITKTLTCDGTNDGEGKYQFYFNIYPG